jgi:MFS family permease
LTSAQAALMVGSVGAGWLMRRTGRYYRLTLAASALTVLTNIILTTWGDNTPGWHLWVDVVGQGAGYAGVLTTTLIVRRHGDVGVPGWADGVRRR